MEPGIERKPVAEIAPILVRHEGIDRLMTIPMGPRRVESAGKAHVHVFAAGFASLAEADPAALRDGLAAMVAHGGSVYPPTMPIQASSAACSKRGLLQAAGCCSLTHMYSTSPCAQAGCPEYAFSGSEYCVNHAADLSERIRTLYENITISRNAINLDLSLVPLVGLDFSRVHFVGCRFPGCRISHTMFTGASFRLCFFDRSAIDSCDFSGIDMDFCSFGDSEIFDTSFENSELIHASFNGTRILECTFSSSNLYDSRFIQSEIRNSRFEDCDFKRVYFMPKVSEGISTANSNFTEAVKDMEHLYI